MCNDFKKNENKNVIHNNNVLILKYFNYHQIKWIGLVKEKPGE